MKKEKCVNANQSTTTDGKTGTTVEHIDEKGPFEQLADANAKIARMQDQLRNSTGKTRKEILSKLVSAEINSRNIYYRILQRLIPEMERMYSQRIDIYTELCIIQHPLKQLFIETIEGYGMLQNEFIVQLCPRSNSCKRS